MADKIAKHQAGSPAITQRLDSLALYADSLYKADILNPISSSELDEITNGQRTTWIVTIGR